MDRETTTPGPARDTRGQSPSSSSSAARSGGGIQKSLAGKGYAEQVQLLKPDANGCAVQLKPDPHHRAPHDDRGGGPATKEPEPGAKAPPDHQVLAALPARANANAALRELSAKQTAYSRDFADWQRANWNMFIGNCGGTPSLASMSGARDLTLSLASKAEIKPEGIGAGSSLVDSAVGNGVGAAAAAGIASGKAALYGPAFTEKLAGFVGISTNAESVFKFLSGGVGGFLAGVFVSFAFDLIRSALSRSSGDEKAADAVSRKNQATLQAVGDHISAGQRSADDKWAQRANELGSTVDAETAVGVLEELARAFKLTAEGLKAPPIGDLTLGHSLLEQWVLQHAGDEEGPSDADTNRESWHKAAERLDDKIDRGDGYRPQHGYKRKDGDILKRTLFEDQCALHWTRLGLDGPAATASLKQAFAAKVKDFGPSDSERAISELASWNHDFADAQNLELWTLRVAPHAYHSAIKVQPKSIDPNGWTTRVAVNLVEENGTFFVDCFRYELLNSGGQSVYRWSQSPD